MAPHRQTLSSQRRFLRTGIITLALLALLLSFFASLADERAKAASVPGSTRQAPTPRPGVRPAFAPELRSPGPQDVLDPGPVYLQGEGPAGYRIRATVDDRSAGETVVDASGSWSLTLDFLQTGDYILSLATVTLDGEVVAVAPPTLLVISEFE